MIAQVVHRGAGAFGLADLAIAVIILAGIVAVTLIVLKAMGLALPPWLVQILAIVAVVVVGVVAIKLLLAV